MQFNVSWGNLNKPMSARMSLVPCLCRLTSFDVARYTALIRIINRCLAIFNCFESFDVSFEPFLSPFCWRRALDEGGV
jgi:hypothetical protein